MNVVNVKFLITRYAGDCCKTHLNVTNITGTESLVKYLIFKMYESACDTKKLSYKGLTVLYVTDCDHKKSEFTKIPSNIYTTSSNKPCRKNFKVSFG